MVPRDHSDRNGRGSSPVRGGPPDEGHLHDPHQALTDAQGTRDVVGHLSRVHLQVPHQEPGGEAFGHIAVEAQVHHR